MPKVSVIMGVYNCKNFKLLRDSIDSILNQTFTDFELLICNDGSTNDTLNQLKQIEELDERIRIISYDTNQGLSFALNTCLKEAKGEYIARQDDDDISKPERLRKQVEFLDKNLSYSFVGTCADVYDDNGVWGKYFVPEKPTKYDFYWNSPFMHPTIVIRKRAYDSVHGYRCAKETRRCEDYDLFMRLYAQGFIGANLLESLYYYRIENREDKRRIMKYRVDEAIVRAKGYWKLHMYPKGILYVLKPIAVGLIPKNIFKRIKEKTYSIH